MERLIRAAINPVAGPVIFVLLIIAFYGVGTWCIDIRMSAHTRSDMLLLPWLSAAGVAIGSALLGSRPPASFSDGRGRIAVYGVALSFLAFCLLTIVTAPSVPLTWNRPATGPLRSSDQAAFSSSASVKKSRPPSWPR